MHESAHEASRWWRDNARALHHTPPRVHAARVVVVVIVVVVVVVVVAVVPARPKTNLLGGSIQHTSAVC